MRSSRQFRFLAALIVLFSMLFTQLAVASYACPTLSPGHHGTSAAMPPGSSAQMMADCSGAMDMEQPSLCHAHDQVGNQSLDKAGLPDVQPFVAVGLMQAVVAINAATEPLPPRPRALYLTGVTAPPLAIRNCCFRI